MICGQVQPLGGFWGEFADASKKVGAGAARGLADYLAPGQAPAATPPPAPVYYAPPPPPAPPKKDLTPLLVLGALFLFSEKGR